VANNLSVTWVGAAERIQNLVSRQAGPVVPKWLSATFHREYSQRPLSKNI